MASMLRTKLSLKAERNWHQNSGANRRDVISVRNMRPPALRLAPFGRYATRGVKRAVAGRYRASGSGPSRKGCAARKAASRAPNARRTRVSGGRERRQRGASGPSAQSGHGEVRNQSR